MDRGVQFNVVSMCLAHSLPDMLHSQKVEGLVHKVEQHIPGTKVT